MQKAAFFCGLLKSKITPISLILFFKIFCLKLHEPFLIEEQGGSCVYLLIINVAVVKVQSFHDEVVESGMYATCLYTLTFKISYRY